MILFFLLIGNLEKTWTPLPCFEVCVTPFWIFCHFNENVFCIKRKVWSKSIWVLIFFLLHRHKKQKEEDIAVCECKFDANDNDSACGEGCLNVLTSTECTPGHCPSGVHCRNQVTMKLLFMYKIFFSLFLFYICVYTNYKFFDRYSTSYYKLVSFLAKLYLSIIK